MMILLLDVTKLLCQSSICLFFYLDRIYRIFRIFLPFPRSAGQAAERQKPISLFEGIHMTIKTEQRNEMNIRQQ